MNATANFVWFCSYTVFQRAVLEFAHLHKQSSACTGRFEHCLMPARRISQSINKEVNSRTTLLNTVVL